MASPSTSIDPRVREGLSDGSLAGAWALDSARSSVELKTKSVWGLVPVRGRFTEVSGQGIVSQAGEVTGSIKMSSASLDTKNKKRDDHLRSADFFDAETHPDITFVLERVDVAEQGATGFGTLEVAGHKGPLQFPMSAKTGSDGTLELDAEAHIDRADFGLTFNQMGMMSMKNIITIHAVFTRN